MCTRIRPGAQFLKENKMLEEGDVIELVAGMEVYADIPEHFVFANKRGSYNLTHYNIVLGGDFDYLIGKYVVIKTVSDGGCDEPGNYYPSGHHVYCAKLDDRSVKVDFYQSGCFTATIKDINPICKAKLEWVLPTELKPC